MQKETTSILNRLHKCNDIIRQPIKNAGLLYSYLCSQFSFFFFLFNSCKILLNYFKSDYCIFFCERS